MDTSATVRLPEGLTLRTARPADLQQIGDLLTARGEPGDAVDHRLVVEDPDLGWGACAVVVDGDRVVSTATLLDEQVRVGVVTLPAGQVELVATDPAYEGRGLVRALMGWAHERSATRGHLLQVMVGIPYFYRLFGYAYALDMPHARTLTAPSGEPETALRPAEARDLPALTRLQDDAQSTYDVAMAHPPARRRWLLEHEATTTWVLGEDVPRASARTVWGDDDVLVAEATAQDPSEARDLLTALGACAGERSIRLVHRPGTTVGSVWEPRLGPAPRGASQYYVRIPDEGALLDALRPELDRRMAAAGLDRTGRDVVVSTFARHYRMTCAPDGLGPVSSGGPMQDPGSAGATAVAPDALATALLGARSVHDLAATRPDVAPGPDEELDLALFPRLTADLLTYYLPW